jgi:hypothetical protein
MGRRRAACRRNDATASGSLNHTRLETGFGKVSFGRIVCAKGLQVAFASLFPIVSAWTIADSTMSSVPPIRHVEEGFGAALTISRNLLRAHSRRLPTFQSHP